MCWFVLPNLDGERRLSSCDITAYSCREQVIFRVQKIAHQKVPNASEKVVAVVETGERDTGK